MSRTVKNGDIYMAKYGDKDVYVMTETQSGHGWYPITSSYGALACKAMSENQIWPQFGKERAYVYIGNIFKLGDAIQRRNL